MWFGKENLIQKYIQMTKNVITFEQYKNFIYKKLEKGYVNKETNTLVNLDDIKNKYKLKPRLLEL